MPSLCFAVACLVAAQAALGAEPPTTLRDGAGLELRLLPAGRYERGSRPTGPDFHKDHADFNSAEDDSPVHPVVITRPFYLGVHEVTLGQFRAFVEATQHRPTWPGDALRPPPPEDEVPFAARLGAVGWDPSPPRTQHLGEFRAGSEFSWSSPGFQQEDNHPVTCVSHADAEAFCRWLSQREGAVYRLPTEAEWEYAARAGSDTQFSFGDAYRGEIARHANIGNVELERMFPERVRRQWLVSLAEERPDEHVFTAPVGSFEANPWGLHDLHGNVWEWCQDRYLDTAYAEFRREGYQQLRKRAIDPRQDDDGTEQGDWRVIRGGSWFNSPIQCRSACRGYYESGDAACYLGFRVVREAPAELVEQAVARHERSSAAADAIARVLGPFREQRDGRLTLRLNEEHLTAGLFARLAELDEAVDIHCDARGKLTGAQLAGLARTRDLRGLVLSGAGPALRDDDLAVLSGAPRLELLQITGAPQLSDKALTPLVGLSQLELLHVQGDGITDEGLRQLAPLPRLRTLHLQGTSAEGALLADLRGAPLETLSCERLTDEQAPLLAEFPRLAELNLNGSPVSGAALASLAKLPRLQRLGLIGCRELHDEELSVLASCHELRSLNLSETDAGDAVAATLPALIQLRDLQIGGPRLSDVGLRRLCECVGLRNLSLRPEAERVTDAGLTDLWRLRNLYSCELLAPRITGTGMGPLAELPKLENLVLESPALTDDALRPLAECVALRQLTIGGRRGEGSPGLSDAGLAALREAPALQRLSVVVRGTAITPAGLDSLRPKLEVQAR